MGFRIVFNPKCPHCTGVAAAASMQGDASHELHNTLSCHPAHKLQVQQVGGHCSACSALPLRHGQQSNELSASHCCRQRKASCWKHARSAPKIGRKPQNKTTNGVLKLLLGLDRKHLIAVQRMPPHQCATYHTTRGGRQIAVNTMKRRF